MVETRQSGLFSYGGLMGRGNITVNQIQDEIDTIQYDSYLKGFSFDTYDLYQSQSGAQGLFFSFLDQVSPFSPHENLRLFRVMASMLLAMTLSLLMVWFLSEFGWTTAILVLITTIASQWLTLFGRNLFYFTAFFYIPLVAVTFFLASNSERPKRMESKLAALVFITILLKTLFNGFDFILPSIGMLGAPLVYFSIRDRWKVRVFLRRGILVTFSVALAVITSLSILAFQITAATGDSRKAITYLTETLERRSLGDPEKFPEYAASLQANVWDVLFTYFTGKTALAEFGVRFVDLIVVFIILTTIYLFLEKSRGVTQINSSKTRALIVATWVSILSPVLWYMLFKGQAYVHTHTNFLAWYMPFVPFGFALSGFVLQNLLTRQKQYGQA